MADEFVRIGQFEEFCRGNDQRFLDLEKKMDQGFAHASKEREHILVHLNLRFDAMEQRFDAMEKRFDARFDGVDKRISDLWKVMVVVLGGILAGAVGAVLKAFF